jgi:hypothetical protein
MCGFVRRESPEGWTVVLPNLKGDVKDPNFHQPALVFYESDVREYSDRNDRDKIPKEYGDLSDRLIIWNLDKEHLEIKLCNDQGEDCILMQDKGVNFRDEDLSHMGKPKTWSQARDMRWIPSMGKLLGSGGEIDSAFLKDSVTSDKIIARMHLPQGKFRCMEIAREPYDSDTMNEYVFVPSNKGNKMTPQALAEVARVEFNLLPQKTLQIASRPLSDPNATPKTVTFRRHNMVNCALVNLPKPRFGKDRRLTKHFAHFYTLLPDYKGKCSVPEMVPDSASSDLSVATLPDLVEVPTRHQSNDQEPTESVRNENLCPFVQYP